MPFGCSSFKYEILEEIGVFGTNDNIEKKLCLVSWGDREPVLDIRPWRNDYTGVQPCKGITLTVEELRQLLTIGFAYLDRLDVQNGAT